MARAPEWTESEFKTVLNHPELSNEELSRILQRRTPGAIAVVREGIHVYHMEKRNPGGILAKMMTRILDEKRDLVRCHKCGKEF